jgi:hypothetical protein
MWLLIFTDISGTYTTACGALTLASIINYIVSLLVYNWGLQMAAATQWSRHTLKTINSNQKLDYQFSVPVDISVSHPIL